MTKMENIEIRNQERENLFNALMTKNSTDQAEYLNRFIALREKRASILEEYLEFENLIETVEGPAWYVELKAYSQKSSQTYDRVLKKYGQKLLDKFECLSTFDEAVIVQVCLCVYCWINYHHSGTKTFLNLKIVYLSSLKSSIIARVLNVLTKLLAIVYLCRLANYTIIRFV